MSGNISFADYIYSEYCSRVFPSAVAIINENIDRINANGEDEFYSIVSSYTESKAQADFGIGIVPAREISRLARVFGMLVGSSSAITLFEHRERIERTLKPVIDNSLANLSIRIKNSFDKCLEEEFGGSFVLICYHALAMPIIGYKFSGLGYDNSQELCNTIEDVISRIAVICSDGKSMEDIVLSEKLSFLGLSKDEKEVIEQSTKRIEHIPFFKILSFLIEKQASRQRHITKYGLRTYSANSVQDLTELAESLQITRERARQLRNKSLEILHDLITNEVEHVFNDVHSLPEYNVTTPSDARLICELEDVDFSRSFIVWVISILRPDLKLVGNIEKALFKTYGDFTSIYLVSGDTSKVFDYEEFIESVEKDLADKRFYEYRDDLENYLKRVSQNDVSDSLWHAILRESRMILEIGYPDNIVNNQIIFYVNARKGIPFLIEDILRDNGKPMTAEDICTELTTRYPDIKQTPKKIGPNALRNSNIVAVSRTSTYALTEWNYTENRGGTIRDIVEEFLNMRETPIASLSDICEYVAKFRDSVKPDSIKSNLMQESSGKYAFFIKDDTMYIGYSGVEYSDKFESLDKRGGRRSFTESLELLEQFIVEHQHFPFYSGVGYEEERLSRFYHVARSNARKGLLTEEEQLALTNLEEKYAHLRSKKERITWMQWFERYATYLTEHDTLPSPSSAESKWFIQTNEEYESGNLDENKVEMFSYLLKIVNNMIN